MIYIIIIFIVFAIISASYIGLFFYTFGKGKPVKIESFTPKKNYESAIEIIKNGIAWFENSIKEDIFIKSYDELKLHAYFIDAQSKKTVILFHGYRSCGKKDFSGIMKYYFEKGFNLLLVDQRAHGMSEGKIITFGVKEKFDAVSWVEYIKERIPSGRIYLGGMSMGTTTVLMASSLVTGVSGIVADCGFTSPKEIITRVAKHKHFPFWTVKPVLIMARLFAKFDCSETTIEAVKKTNIPILFVHGKSDKFVPCEMTERNYASCASQKQIVLVENASHGFSFLVDSQSIINELEKIIL